MENLKFSFLLLIQTKRLNEDNITLHIHPHLIMNENLIYSKVLKTC